MHSVMPVMDIVPGEMEKVEPATLRYLELVMLTPLVLTPLVLTPLVLALVLLLVMLLVIFLLALVLSLFLMPIFWLMLQISAQADPTPFAPSKRTAKPKSKGIHRGTSI